MANKKKVERVTNAEFARTDNLFMEACEKVKSGKKDDAGRDKTLPATARQAGKWRRKTGLAWKMRNK